MAVTGVRGSSTESEGVELYLALYRQMLVIRRTEDLVQTLFLRGEIYGTTHLYSGQEAVAVGFASALQEGDRVACTYRGHGHTLAMRLEPEKLLAELLGRATGVNGGRAGSMNVVDLEHARDADGDCLLAGVEMGGAVDLAAQEERLDQVLEAPDQDHRAVEAEVELRLADDRQFARMRHLRSFTVPAF